MSATITPLASLADRAKLMQQFFGAQPMDPTQQQNTPAISPGADGPQASNAPATFTPAATAPSAPAQAMTTPAPTLSRDEFFAQNPDAANAFMPPRPVNELENVHGIRRALALAFGGLDTFGGGLNHQPGTTLPRWNQEAVAQAQYDANAPNVRAGAIQQAYNTYLQNQRGQAETNETNQRANLLGVQAQNYVGPFQQQAQATFEKLKQMWSSGQYDPATFDKLAQSEIALLPPGARNLVLPQMDTLKNLPVNPPMFQMKENSIQPLIWRGQQYGLSPTPGEPPEITNARGLAVRSLQEQQLKNLDPIIRGQLGEPPSDPAQLQAYMQKAEQIKEHMNTAGVRATFTLQNGGLGGGGSQPSPMAKAVADGSMKWGDVISTRTPMSVKSQFLNEVKSINPNFNSGDYELEQGVKKDFLSGQDSQKLQAQNTAIVHLPIFIQKAKELDNGNAQALNSLGQAYNTQFGSDQAGNFNIAKQAFLGEVGRAFDGAGVAEGDRRALESSVQQMNSFTQLAGAARTALQLLEGKRKVLQEQYQAGIKAQPNFGTPSASAHQVGDTVSIRGKQMKVTAVHPDGSFDAQ